MLLKLLQAVTIVDNGVAKIEAGQHRELVTRTTGFRMNDNGLDSIYCGAHCATQYAEVANYTC